MSNETQTQIGLPFPIINSRVSAKYSATEKPSGLGYMLLKMIGLGVSENLTFQELIEEFGLPEDVFYIFKDELNSLFSKKMIIFKSDIHLDSEISLISFTKLGLEAFSKGVISQEPKDFTTELYFAPGKKDKIYKSNNNFKQYSKKVDEGLFQKIAVDSSDLEEFLKSDKNKSYYKIKKEEDIFDFKLESTIPAIYEQSVKLLFDKMSAQFSLYEGDMDMNFIKSHYSFDFIMNFLNPCLFESSSSDIDIRKWGEIPMSWNNYDYLLPKDFIVRDSELCLFDSEYCIVKGNSFSTPVCLKKLDSNAVIITSLGAFAYHFVNEKISIKGYEGSMKSNLVVHRLLSPEETDECLKEVLKSINLDETQGFIQGIDVCRRMIDSESEIQALVIKHLLGESIHGYHTAAVDLKKYENEKWHKKLPEFIEESLCERTDLLKNGKEIADLLFSLSSEKIKSDWSSLLPLLFSSNSMSNSELADYCLDKGLDKRVIIRSSGILESLVQSILENEKIEGKSKFFSTVSNIRYNLAKLQNLTGISSFSEYSFDIDSIDDEIEKQIVESVSTLSSSFDAFSSELKSLNLLKEVESSLDDIRRYLNIFKSINVTLKNRNKKMNQKDLLKEPNPRLFGISLGIRLENILKTMVPIASLNEMLEDVRQRQFISESDFKSLDEFRDFRNKCAHEAEIQSPNQEKKSEWLSLVFRFELPAEEAKK
jgi:hypothetical protein